MDAHAVGKCGVQPGQRLFLVERERAMLGQCRTPPPLDDPALPHDHGLAWQYPADAGKNRLAPGGELHLHELVARPAIKRRGDNASLDQRTRLGGKGEAAQRLGVIERLDPERVAGEDQAPGARVVQCHRVHTAQMQGKVEPVTAVEVQRQLAIRLSGAHDRPGA